MSWLKENWKWTLVNSIAMMLFTSFLWQAASNGFSAASVRFLVGSTGNLAIIYLLLSLAMTPLHIILGWRGGLPLKKTTGLWAFAFGMMHMIYYAVEKGTLSAIFGDFYLIVGLIPLLIMAPLALTSTNWWMRTLGQWWKPLHRTVYIAGITAGLHTALVGNPLLAGLMLILLAVRIPLVRRWFSTQSKALSKTTAPAPRIAHGLHPKSVAR